jgi:hypothetical protein
MTTRRRFLTQLARTAAGLLLAPDALELILEPRRRLWPGADFGGLGRSFIAGAQGSRLALDDALHAYITTVSDAYFEYTRATHSAIVSLPAAPHEITGRRLVVSL